MGVPKKQSTRPRTRQAEEEIPEEVSLVDLTNSPQISRNNRQVPANNPPQNSNPLATITATVDALQPQFDTLYGLVSTTLETTQQLAVEMGQLKAEVISLKTEVNAMKQQANSNDDKLCKICMAQAVAACLIPCGHVFCSVCANGFGTGKLCPFCKTTVKSIQPIFLS